MRIIIVGGGKLAYYLIKTLRPYRHQISLIELQKEVSEKIATDFDEVDVFNGDGTSIRMLTEVGCQNADFYIAVTGKDENNLVGCQVAKKRFNIKHTVARVNNPKNAEMFTRLGVDKVYSGTSILADIIEQEVDYEGMRIALKIERTKKSIVEFSLSPRSTACGAQLENYNFPGDSKVVLITRTDGTVESPRGNLIMKPDDTILLICDEDDYGIIWKNMVRR
ncbi:MAG: TrkA family potassium uptake protein [Eubacteriales bacterium]|nr:TrkA family potassium uptake protein [Eubacteriales bacterium]